MNSHYIVCDEHTLGFLFPNGDVQVLRSLESKGAPFELNIGFKPISCFFYIRQAQIKDFVEYRISLPPDFSC